MKARTLTAVLLAALSLHVGACDKTTSGGTTEGTKGEPTVADSRGGEEHAGDDGAGEEGDDEQKKPGLLDGIDGTKSDPIMWVHRGENGPTYLLGSVHMGVDVEKNMAPVVLAALDRSSTFASEADVQAAAPLVLKRAILPEGRTLEDELGEETYAKLEEILDGSLSSYKGFKPFFIVSLLGPKMMPPEAPLGMMDLVLENRARANGAKIGYLEEASFQLDLLEETMTPEVLEEMVGDFENQKEVMGQMLVHYLEGDADALNTTFMEQATASDADRYEGLLFKRNENWVPRLKEILDAGDGFVVFGAAHAFGDRGVIALLEKEGYAFERVKAGSEVPPKATK
jgi:hypothetical protein